MIRGQASIEYRLNILWALIALAGGVLGLRLAQLQILENVEYTMAAERNRTQVIHQAAPRGRIYDRNGIALATSRPAFSLIYLPGKKDKTDLRPLALDLGRQLKQDPAELLGKLEQAVQEETAIRLAENLPPQTMFRLSEIKTIYPGVDLIVEARRYYPYGALGAHTIGYMGKMDPRSWKDLKAKGYRVDSRIGRMGLEQLFETELRGIDGGIRMEVDAQGRLKRILERIPWQVGSNVHLTIDWAMQKAADEGLKKSPSGVGAVVALDPRSGAVLAFASAPAFDPNELLSEDPEVVKRALESFPEFNHAISGTYPPGSTFKLVTGAAGIEEGRIDPSESVFCPGHFELGKRVFLCWEKKGHRAVSWLAGLSHSCDVYFYKMGLKTGGALIEKYSRLFGLGSKTKIILKPERSGNLFGPEARSKTKRNYWFDGDTLNLAIGQGELLVTPMQMASLISTFANRGTIWRPHLIERIEYVDGRPEYHQRSEKLDTIALKSRTWDLVHDALAQVVSSGTAIASRIPGVDFRGKTGTAQNPGGDDHAWFIAFASKPGETTPSIAVAVLVENGGHGSSVAAPIAKSVVMAGFRIEEKKAAVSIPRSTSTLSVPLPGRVTRPIESPTMPLRPL